jgi:outer membrane protein OmpA-like peptidoglycan-associated protein
VVTATQSSGTCEITATVAEGTNYLTASVATPLVITTGTKSVTITASNADVNFGTTVTTNVLNTSSLGLVFGDSIESSGATFTYQGTGSTVYGPSTVKPTNAGTYSVTPSAAVLATGSTSNYNFTYVAGTVSISKVSRTLAFGGGGSATVNYGNTLTVAANPSAGDGAVTYSAGSSTGCSVNASTGVVTATNSSGTCAISASIAAGTNHLTAATGSSFTVTLAKKNITLKTADLEVTEGGDVEPATEVSVGALVGSDAISSATFTFVGTGTTTYGPSNVAPTAIGTYDVTPSVPVFGAGSATNYTIAFAAGALTINVRPPAPSPGGVAAQPVVGPAIAGVTARGSENGKGSFLRVRLDKTPAAFEQLTVVVRLLDLKGELVEELRIPVSQGSSMLEIPINRPMGQFNAVAQISSSTATNAAAKLRPAPLQHSTIREATEEKPIRLLGKRLSQPVLFTAESAKLTPAIKRELRKAARVAKESGSRLAVTGFHALSGRGEAFEQSLAEKRALRVARYLRNQGVENWILFDGLSGAEGQQFPGQPRRVEIRVLK